MKGIKSFLENSVVRGVQVQGEGVYAVIMLGFHRQENCNPRNTAYLLSSVITGGPVHQYFLFAFLMFSGFFSVSLLPTLYEEIEKQQL